MELTRRPRKIVSFFLPKVNCLSLVLQVERKKTNRNFRPACYTLFRTQNNTCSGAMPKETPPTSIRLIRQKTCKDGAQIEKEESKTIGRLLRGKKEKPVYKKSAARTLPPPLPPCAPLAWAGPSFLFASLILVSPSLPYLGGSLSLPLSPPLSPPFR